MKFINRETRNRYLLLALLIVLYIITDLSLRSCQRNNENKQVLIQTINNYGKS